MEPHTLLQDRTCTGVPLQVEVSLSVQVPMWGASGSGHCKQYDSDQL